MADDGDLLVLGDPDERVVRVELLVAEALKRWGRPVRMSTEVRERVDRIWSDLGICESAPDPH